MLADLRESGAIEQDADVVMFLYRDEVYNPGGDVRGYGRSHRRQHRSGPTGTINLGFVPRFTSFRNLTRRDV